MGLFIPTSNLDRRPYPATPVMKGIIYNLDLNESVSFQFNPETFSFERRIKWAEVTWRGDDTGGDVQFFNIGPRTFDLELLYIHDPAAPPIEYRQGGNPLLSARPVSLSVSAARGSSTIMPFETVQDIIDTWMQLLPDRQRPSQIQIIIGPQSFKGIIKGIGIDIRSFFPNLTAREAILTLEFREWLNPQLV